MAKHRFDMHVVQGCSFRQPWRVGGGTAAAGITSPYDLTDALIELRVVDASGGSMFETTSEGSMIVIVDASDGSFEIDLDAATTAAFEPGNGRYSLFVTLADGQRFVGQGAFIVEDSVEAAS
jgi:hypothetical protein